MVDTITVEVCMSSKGQEHPAELAWRLAAFAFADVAGYSRAMGDDAMGTVRNWSQLREQLLLPSITEAGGKVIGGAGDSLLAEFPSATAAVTWALSVQKAIRLQSATAGSMQVRIGVNVDDVVDDGETLQSDGVNIASRIHQLAAPGEIVTTQVTRNWYAAASTRPFVTLEPRR